MPQTPHTEKHFTSGELVRDIVIGMSDGLTVPFALAARASNGNGSDAPDFDPLLFQSWRRAKVRTVVADAGFDSETNHRIARLDMNLRSIRPARRKQELLLRSITHDLMLGQESRRD
jgi:hypothetical protein